MIFIPKKLPQEHHGTIYHKPPPHVRPLSVGSTDNRLTANAVRIRIEPLLAQAVSDAQRGFLPGRSQSQNVTEFDGHMRAISLGHLNPAAVFFDFTAAFPSISLQPTIAVLEHIRLPRHIQLFVKALYMGSCCIIVAAGMDAPGFDIRAGIRQGCP
jgi:hypothetical protein